MADVASFDFIFEAEEDISRTQLLQGDLLVRTPDLAGAIMQAHSYYATAGDYTHFLVLTQSCDLVRRKQKCKSRYITVCAVRPLSLAVEREFETYVNPVAGCPIPICAIEKNVLARQFLERVLNNTVDGMFFIPKGSADTVTEHMSAFLPLSIALRVDHYDVCLKAKVAQSKQIFAAKVGSLASNLYARIATTDLQERHGKAAVENYTKIFFNEIGYTNMVWLSQFQRSEFETRVADELAQSQSSTLSRSRTKEILDELPNEADAIADRVAKILAKRGLIQNDDLTIKKARNIINNDAVFTRLTRR